MFGAGILGALSSQETRSSFRGTAEQGVPFLFPQSFGAKADGQTLDTVAINTAIRQASAQGGGTVYMAAGTYLCGTITLESRVTLYLEAGAVLLGSKNVADYTPQPGPGPHSDAGQLHLIFARDAEDATLAGPGKIDGQGPSFWVPSGRSKLPIEEHWRDVATYDFKPLPRVSPMLEFVACKHLRVEQVRIENSSGWTMRLINCDSVVVDGISIKNPVVGPNVDGIDISNSSNVRIANALIDTADDAICLKSEVHNPYSTENIVTRNITVTNCMLSSCCNGFKFGTAGHGGFENVLFSNSIIVNNEVDYSERVIAGIAIEVVDGGWAEGIVMTGIRMQRTRTPIFLRLGNRTPNPNGRAGWMKGVMLSDIHATGCILTSSITGIPDFNVEDITLSNIHIQTEEPGKHEWATRKVPEQVPAYPEARMFGRLPSYGLYARHVHGLRLRDLVFETLTSEGRPAIQCDDVSDLEISGLRVPEHGTGSAVIALHDTRTAWLRTGRAPAGVPAYVALSGAITDDILLTENDLRKAVNTVSMASNVSASAATVAGSNLVVSQKETG
jgi:polygalacturonase